MMPLSRCRACLVASVIVIAAGCAASCSTPHSAGVAPPPAAGANGRTPASAAGSAAAQARDPAAERTAAALDHILAGDQRSAEHRARDIYRHPRETLLFFGIRPDMRVVEVWPDAGWYTEIIAPLVQAHGKYYAALEPADPQSSFIMRSEQAFRDKLAARPALYGGAELTTLGSGSGDIAPAGTVDMVLTFRNLHDWMSGGWAPQAFAAIYRALKPGGILGVTDHRGNSALPQDPRARNGYVNEDYAIRLIESAGFKLVAKSEINANPKDTKDYPQGVWTLPPTFRLGTTDRDKYAAIGESDRFTLKFIKPVTTSP